MESIKKLPLAYCKKVLESSGKQYGNGEVEKIRDLLYKLGELDYRISMDMNKGDNSFLNQNKAA
jgi:hypothetical protein